MTPCQKSKHVLPAVNVDARIFFSGHRTNQGYLLTGNFQGSPFTSWGQVQVSFSFKIYLFLLFKYVFLLFMCMAVCMHVCICTLYDQAVSGDQKKTLDSLEVEFQMIVNYCVGAWNPNWNLYKSRHC